MFFFLNKAKRCFKLTVGSKHQVCWTVTIFEGITDFVLVHWQICHQPKRIAIRRSLLYNVTTVFFSSNFRLSIRNAKNPFVFPFERSFKWIGYDRLFLTLLIKKVNNEKKTKNLVITNGFFYFTLVSCSYLIIIALFLI